MDERDYKAAFDSVKFSETFERDTIGYLMSTVNSQKEKSYMKTPRFLKTAAIVAVMAVVLSVSAFAAWKLLTPKDVALRGEDQALAEAFSAEDAISINESAQTGELTVTLLGIVSGKDISDFWVKRDGELVDNLSYIVVSVAYTDGRAITMEPDDEIYGNVRIAAMFEGYAPWTLNSMMFSGGDTWFIEDGVLYQCASCNNLEIFADRTVYLGVYTDGIAPGSEMFAIDENGTISIKKEYDKPCALFELPLDPSGADPDAVNDLLKTNDILIP